MRISAGQGREDSTQPKKKKKEKEKEKEKDKEKKEKALARGVRASCCTTHGKKQKNKHLRCLKLPAGMQSQPRQARLIHSCISSKAP